MKLDIHKRFRLAFQIGLCFLFISLFLDWYIFQTYDSNDNLISHWTFNPITGWNTLLYNNSTENYLFKPQNIHIPIELIVLYIIVLLLSAYSMLFKDVEQNTVIEKLIFYAYIHFFLLALVGFFIFMFPMFYLLPSRLYFPFLRVKDKDLNITYFHSIGPGYCLQIIGFILIFPYIIFYYRTVIKFKSVQYTSKKLINKYLQEVQEVVDFDQLIANERIKLKFEDDGFIELESSKIYQNKAKKKKRVL